MKKLTQKAMMILVIIMAMMTGASDLMAQATPTITLFFNEDSTITVYLRATAENTTIDVTGALGDYDITVGTSWEQFSFANSDGGYINLEGNINGLKCGNNNGKLDSIDISENNLLKHLECNNNGLSMLDVSNNTALEYLDCSDNFLNELDISRNILLTQLDCSGNEISSLGVFNNTHLRELYCYNNDLDTDALDAIFCDLPNRNDSTDAGEIFPIYDSSLPYNNIVLATNKANATSKNWNVQYFDDYSDIPATTGTYTCPQLNMDSYITLTVKKDSAIKLDFKAAADGTPIRIVSGSNTQNITVGTDWYDGGFPSDFTVTASASTMTIYGDIEAFDCSNNLSNLSAIDVSKNTQLNILDCGSNQLTTLDVSHNTQLSKLSCSSSQLTSLDVSKNTQLAILNCFGNRLTALDVTKNTKFKRLVCYGNIFSTQVLDSICCSLPDRTDSTAGVIYPVYNASSTYNDTVIATNAQNATAKNWKVRYSQNNADIPATTGSYVCGTPHTDIAEAAAEPALTLYPNPVADVLYLSATARTIRVYNIYGIEVAHATDTDKVEVSHLPAGVYTVKADGSIAKMVKR